MIELMCVTASLKAKLMYVKKHVLVEFLDALCSILTPMLLSDAARFDGGKGLPCLT